MEDEILTGFPSTAGGVLTEKVGAITGELFLSTRLDGERVEVFVGYVGSDDLYAVAGSPLTLDSRTHEKVHWDIIERIQTPRGDGFRNEPPADLR